MEAKPILINGINAETGEYLLPPLTADDLAAVAQGETLEPDHLRELRWRYQTATQGHYGVKEGVNADKLEEAGWGVIFGARADPAVRDALKELLDWRKEQASRKDERFYKEYSGPDGYRPNESKQDFLARHGAGPGPAEPEKVPYYLLIVGDPEEIPYRVQYQVDVQYAVGRIHFDTLDDYARYAHSVVEAEKGGVALAKKAAFFATANPNDEATRLSADELVGPLTSKLAATQTGWELKTWLKDAATKPNLAALLGGSETPAVLFSASHGLGLPNGHPRQLSRQGALLCQEWGGPLMGKGPLSADAYFSADDIGSDAGLLGLIAFTFACYGAGTPRLDEFARQAFKDTRAEVAPQAFVASLPKRMLAHPKGGALAVVGHVERAWSYSFRWGKPGREAQQLAVFESTMRKLMGGQPIGLAMEFFNERYAELASDLSAELEEISFGKKVDSYDLAGMWTANNDARNYVIIGDPAVRLPLAADPAQAKPRPLLADTISTRPESAKPTSDEASSAAPPAEGSKAVDQLAPGGASGAQEFGIIEDTIEKIKGIGQKAGEGISEFAQKVSDYLGNALEDASKLEVRTYTSDDLAAVEFDGKALTGSSLRALTVIKVDGDTLAVVPQTDGQVDAELWQVHLQLVQQAQAARADFLRTVVDLARGMMKG